MTELIKAHGGSLTSLMLDSEQAQGIKPSLGGLLSWPLTQRQLCDFELILNGGFSPLEGFMTKDNYESVVNNMHLSEKKIIWPMPITLDVNQAFADQLTLGDKIVLRDFEQVPLAVMTLSDIWQPDKQHEAKQVFSTDNDKHPGVNYLFHSAGEVYLGGTLQGLSLPRYYDFNHLRYTPREMRALFKKQGWSRVVAFQTRNPMHRAHQELTFRAATLKEASLLIHPVVGMTKPGDVDHYTRVRCYEKILQQYPERTTQLGLLPLAMRMGGPREALWHAIIRKNYGCSYFIVGRDHAGPGKDENGQDFYDPYAAQELVKKHQGAVEIEMVPFQEMVYLEEKAEYVPVNEVKPEQKPLKISGTEFRRRLQKGLEIPIWFSYPEVIEELRRTHPPKNKQGFTIFFTGLSGAGKSTLANASLAKLMENGSRPVTLLDGDVVRRKLSSELGFSKAHRDLNILRIAYVASQITKNGGIAICAPIAPYELVRQQVRREIAASGGFIEVHVATSLAVCEARDRKGLYAQARAGKIKGFTGIDDPYEKPVNPELTIDTAETSVSEAVQQILLKLEKLGYL